MCGDQPGEVHEALAMDIKAMMSALRKIRRAWKYNGKAQGKTWPQIAMNEDLRPLLSLMEIIQDLETDDSASTAKPSEPRVKAEPPEDQEEKLMIDFVNNKRKRVLEELHGKCIRIVDDDDACASQAGTGTLHSVIIYLQVVTRGVGSHASGQPERLGLTSGFHRL